MSSSARLGSSWLAAVLATLATAIMATEKPGQERQIILPELKMEFMPVPADSFRMGSDKRANEQPMRMVTLTKSFWMAKTEVTKEQFEKVMGKEFMAAKSKTTKTLRQIAKNDPIHGVNWHEAVKFCQELTRQASGKLPPGYVFRLPTEAEWEYAASGGQLGSGLAYSGSEEVTEVAWCETNSGGKAQPVAKLKANELGIHDLSGNLWEWCHDWFGDYPASNESDPVGPRHGTVRVFRGGGWNYSPAACQVTSRGSYSPNGISIHVGIRAVIAPPAD